jgi:hypothetical protein
VWELGEQSGVTPPQLARSRQPTHTPPPDEVSHSGAEDGQWDVSAAVQAVHAPLEMHSGVAGPQSALLAQARQLCDARSQTGVTPPHWAAETQATQAAVATSQTGVLALQRVALLAEHCPHAPPGWQAGRAPPQSVSAAHARQACDDGSHTGVAPAQSALAAQPMQVPLARSQSGVAPVHRALFPAEHCPHAPEGWQAGVAPPQSASAAHARQACAGTLHTGVTPAQSALDTQATQVPVPTSHDGVAPPHLARLLAEQTPQAPEGWQAGVAPPPQSPSAAHARQTREVASQVGVAPPHWAAERQATQVPVPLLQRGVAPVQATELVAEQTPQAPEGWQAVVAPPHSLSAAQPRQEWNAGSHTGADAAQSASARQATQLPEAV